MMGVADAALSKFVDDIAGNHAADLYRSLWGERRHFGELPLLTRDFIVQTPLSRRRYKHATSLMKVVHTRSGPFLSEWSFDDIAREPWGEKCERPLVYMSDPHEAIEKSLWCYENGVLPVLGERSAEVTAYAASLYEVQEMITDPVAAMLFLPYLESRAVPLEAMTLIAERFHLSEMKIFEPHAKKITLAVALPETGAIAVGHLDDATFTALPNCRIEKIEGEYVVTKVAPLVTPIIRYKTGLREDHLVIV